MKLPKASTEEISKSAQLDRTFNNFGKTIHVCSKGLDILEVNNVHLNFSSSCPRKAQVAPSKSPFRVQIKGAHEQKSIFFIEFPLYVYSKQCKLTEFSKIHALS